MTRSSTPTDEWPEPVRLACLVALVATHGLVRLAERYLPEFASALGYGPILVGAVLTLGLGVAVVATSRERTSSSGTDELSIAGLAGMLTALGLLAWTGAPALDALLGIPISALGWLAVGIALVQAWRVRGPVRRLWPIDAGVAGRASSASDRRKPIVVGGVGVGAAAVFSTAAVASAGGVRAGFALVTAAGAAVALVATITLGIVETESIRLRDRLSAPPRDGATAAERPSVTAIWRAVTALPDRRRWTIVGDALVRIAIVGSSPYLILLLVEQQPVALSIGGLSLAPVAVFGLFVLAEASGAIVGTAAFPALDSSVDPLTVLTVGLAVLSLIPMTVLVAPPSSGVVALLFVLLGCRTAIEPLRPTVGMISEAAPDERSVSGRSPPPAVRTAVRFALVPAPLVGGVLYAIGPIAAFTLATTVGLLGVRELLRALAQKHYG